LRNNRLAFRQLTPALPSTPPPFPPARPPQRALLADFHAACARGDAASAVALVKAGARVDALDGAKCSPLSTAARLGHEDLARALIAAGASLESPEKGGRGP